MACAAQNDTLVLFNGSLLPENIYLFNNFCNVKPWWKCYFKLKKTEYGLDNLSKTIPYFFRIKVLHFVNLISYFLYIRLSYVVLPLRFKQTDKVSYKVAGKIHDIKLNTSI